MAQFWILESISGTWQPVPLCHAAYALDENHVKPAGCETNPGSATELHDVGGLWVLSANEEVRVNGTPVYGGVRALRNHDEIRIGACRMFFSTEEPPRMVEFTGSTEPVTCGRCRQPLTDGVAAVRCRCGLWHHQTEELPCWTYAIHCASCEQTTTLDGTYPWSPSLL